MEKRTFKPKDFSKLISVSVRTLQQWDRDGILKAKRTPTNRRYYTYEQYLDLLHFGMLSRNLKKDMDNYNQELEQTLNSKKIQLFLEKIIAVKV